MLLSVESSGLAGVVPFCAEFSSVAAPSSRLLLGRVLDSSLLPLSNQLQEKTAFVDPFFVRPLKGPSSLLIVVDFSFQFLVCRGFSCSSVYFPCPLQYFYYFHFLLHIIRVSYRSIPARVYQTFFPVFASSSFLWCLRPPVVWSVWLLAHFVFNWFSCFVGFLADRFLRLKRKKMFVCSRLLLFSCLDGRQSWFTSFRSSFLPVGPFKRYVQNVFCSLII